MKKPLLLISVFLFAIALIRCGTEKLPPTSKLSANDPFKATMVPSQDFELDADKDNVLEGKEGTVIVFPKGCFKDGNGNIVEGKVKVEMAEALNAADMLLSNLNTTADGKLLETGGMVYLNATANGEQLSINKDIPVHIEIPTEERKPGMMAYKGIRDENGNMNWVEPKELDNYLVTVDINSLDFLPNGFRKAAREGMLALYNKQISDATVDSLYFSLNDKDHDDLLMRLAEEAAAREAGYQMNVYSGARFNEAYYNKNKQVVDGKYTEESFNVAQTKPKQDTARPGYGRAEVGRLESEGSFDSIGCWSCGIDPASVQVLRSEKFQNTFIATREFETRLKQIFLSCDRELISIYINNLDKDLWIADSLVAIRAGLCDNQDDIHINFQEIFKKFSAERRGNVKGGAAAGLLKAYYQEQLKKVKEELEEKAKKGTIKIKKQSAEYVQAVAEYKDLLWKREKYRMETYGFDWTETGWLNVDIGTQPKEWGPQPLEILVDNGNQYDRVYTYVVYTSIKSLYRLNPTDKTSFYVGNDQEKQMLMPKKKTAVAIAIAYKGEAPALALKEFETGTDTKLSLSLSASSKNAIEAAIKPYEKYEQENKISEDLRYMEIFYREEQKQMKEMQEQLKQDQFMLSLYNCAYPCCWGYLPGTYYVN